MQTRTKKIVALAAVGLLVVVIAFAAVITMLVRGAESHPPTLTAYSHGETVDVPPLQYCNLSLDECDQGSVTELEVPVGSPLQLSLPKDISAAPWRMIIQYQDANGNEVLEQRSYESGPNSAITIESTDDRQLLVVELQLPSSVIDEEGRSIAHAIWSIQTA
ncbi:MAG: DUF2771 domain-containing protein [Rhodococcus sp.]|nr:DUF2771 domain-containing protein [Rhodococcus sp. (in: high G+C Gram-positive bacteria)]